MSMPTQQEPVPVSLQELKEMLEKALDRQLEYLDLNQNFYTELGLDSMGAVALFIEVQRKTGVEIPLAEAPMIQNCEQLLSYLNDNARSVYQNE